MSSNCYLSEATIIGTRGMNRMYGRSVYTSLRYTNYVFLLYFMLMYFYPCFSFKK